MKSRVISLYSFAALVHFCAGTASLVAEPPAVPPAPLPEIDWAGQKISVLFFLLHDCPISNSYVPEMNRIARHYANRGVQVVAVYSDSDLALDAAQQHAREYKLEFPFVIDTDKKLVTSTGTKIAPQVAVLNNLRELLYRGRIDDLYGDIDKKRPAATQHDLQDALEDVIAGRKPKQAHLPGIGCPIEDRRPGS